MVRDHFLAFDDMISSTTYSSRSTEALAVRLAWYDQIALQAVVDRVTGTSAGTLGVTIETSPDGSTWVTHSLAIDPSDPGSAIHLAATSVMYGFSAPQPALSFVRLSLALGGGVTAAHVKVFAVCRDPS
jgi:hypothetical protein